MTDTSGDADEVLAQGFAIAPPEPMVTWRQAEECFGEGSEMLRKLAASGVRLGGVRASVARRELQAADWFASEERATR